MIIPNKIQVQIDNMEITSSCEDSLDSSQYNIESDDMEGKALPRDYTIEESEKSKINKEII